MRPHMISWPLFWSCTADHMNADRSTKRRPFAAWVKRLTNLKGGEQNGGSGKKSGNVLQSKSRKGNNAVKEAKNNPYPESGFVPRETPRSSADGFATPASYPQNDDRSIISGAQQEGDTHASNRSAAPTVATHAGTVHSDAGHSKAFTNTTGGGAFSSIDGRGGGHGSTFSSPNQSERSLTTTLTTIQSTSPANALQQTGTSGHNVHNSQPNGQAFTHQYPVSPAPSGMGMPSAIPRHLTDGQHNSSNNVLTDDASIVTLASSSKRRRRSMDTDASVRALAPNSVWGGSRESLPLSVLSGNNAHDAASTTGLYAPSRPSIGGFASAERASVYSSQGVSAPALASERNSYYAGPRKDMSDAKSLRSITNLDARSQRDTDAKSINDARSFNADTRSLRNYEGSIRSGALGHGRNDSIPGSIGSPLASPGLRIASGNNGALSRRSSDRREMAEGSEDEDEEMEKTADEADDKKGHHLDAKA